MLEIWLDVVGYEGLYQISNAGRVRSFVRCKKGRMLRPTRHKTRGAHIILCKNSDHRTKKIHHLVLEAFIGPKPGGMECAHWDDDPLNNNNLDNLRWATPTENREDSRRNGTLVLGSNHPTAKLSESDIPSIHSDRENGMSYRNIATKYKVSHTLIIRVLQGRAWKHVEV